MFNGQENEPPSGQSWIRHCVESLCHVAAAAAADDDDDDDDVVCVVVDWILTPPHHSTDGLAMYLSGRAMTRIKQAQSD